MQPALDLALRGHRQPGAPSEPQGEVLARLPTGTTAAYGLGASGPHL